MNKKIFIVIAIVMFVAGMSYSQPFEYVGASKCKMCHNKEEKGAQYKKWLETRHSKAWEVLANEESKKYSENPQTDPKCLKCHATYYTASEDLMSSITKEEGVSCESCHGAGSGYKTAKIMKDRKLAMENGLVMLNEDGCKKCHNTESPTFKGFDYNTAFKQVDHQDPTRE